MLDKILKDVYKINDTEIIYENNKPVLKNGLKKISVSHSGEFIALAFSDYDCGIDIEKNKERNYEKIAKRMKFNCKNKIEFYQEWTKFEAEYKLNTTPKSLKFCKVDDYILCVVSIKDNEEFNLYTLTT
jgi:phosphopantetheinyl transferase